MFPRPPPRGGWDQEDPTIQNLILAGCVETNTDYLTTLPDLILHLCSGPLGDDSFGSMIVAAATAIGRQVVVLAIDPIVHSSLDLLQGSVVSWLGVLCRTGRVKIAFAGPPCSTWSRARWHRLPGDRGPRPLRERSRPLQCMSGRSVREHDMCAVGSWLALCCIYLQGLAWCYSAWVGLEHPEDFGASVRISVQL